MSDKNDIVYVVESGDYEDSCVYGIFSSVEVAVSAIRLANMKDQYSVEWEKPARHPDGGGYTLVGHFSRARCNMHDLNRTEKWTITPYLLDEFGHK